MNNRIDAIYARQSVDKKDSISQRIGRIKQSADKPLSNARERLIFSNMEVDNGTGG